MRDDRRGRREQLSHIVNNTTDGEEAAPLLVAVVDAVAARFGDRHLATYAIGSLSHGGFSPSVSDVDMVVLLARPLAADDGAAFVAIKDDCIARKLPLADRLSIFWETVPIDGRGRLPAIDRLDLLDSGRVLAGADVRGQIARPTSQEMARDTLEFVVGMFSDRVIAVMDKKLGPDERRFVTKVILFPVRFLYTLRTGKAGRVEDAVADYAKRETSAGKLDLVERALACRDGETSFQELIDRPRIRALYDEFIAEYRTWLRDAGETALADKLDRSMSELAHKLG